MAARAAYSGFSFPYFEKVLLVQNPLTFGVGNDGPLVVDEITISARTVANGVGDGAQGRSIESCDQDSLGFSCVIVDGGGDDDDRRIGDSADDDVGEYGLSGHGFLEVFPISQRGGFAVRILSLTVRSDHAHTKIVHS
jgi:hypothetical protein